MAKYLDKEDEKMLMEAQAQEQQEQAAEQQSEEQLENIPVFTRISDWLSEKWQNIVTWYLEWKDAGEEQQEEHDGHG